MNLSFTHAKVCAYVFDLDLDPRYETQVMQLFTNMSAVAIMY